MDDDLPRDLLLRPAVEAARRVALASLAQARAAAGRLADTDDPSALHDLRVAVRRVRTTLRAWRRDLENVGRRRRDALGAFQDETGAGRDAEVQLAWVRTVEDDLDSEERPGCEAYAERLRRLRAGAAEAGAGVWSARFSAIEEALRRRLARYRVEVRLDGGGSPPTYATALAPKARAAARKVAKKLLAIEDAEDRRRVHRARILAKRLRYLVEPAAGRLPEADAVVERLRVLQDVLGDLHDAHVLEDSLVRWATDLAAGERTGAEALLLRCRERARRLFEELRSHGRAGGEEDLLPSLLGRVDDLAAALLRAGAPPREIERKYLLSSLPDLPSDAEAIEIDQGWLPGRTVRERVRRARRGATTTCTRTIKAGSGVVRSEWEEETSAVVFEALWPLTEGARVRKRRHRVPSGARTWEVDEFLDRDLVLAEIELERPDEAVTFPPWLAPYVVRDVTGEPGYVNQNLAR